MSAGQLPPPGTVLRKYDRNGAVRCEAVVGQNGQVTYNGVTYSSISAAAKVAAGDIGLAARSCDGYAFFGLKGRDGGSVPRVPRVPRPAGSAPQTPPISLPLPLPVRWDDLPAPPPENTLDAWSRIIRDQVPLNDELLAPALPLESDIDKTDFDHSSHGRADASGAPLDPDCACRANRDREKTCAESGCGFCRAAQAMACLTGSAPTAPATAVPVIADQVRFPGDKTAVLSLAPDIDAPSSVDSQQRGAALLQALDDPAVAGARQALNHAYDNLACSTNHKPDRETFRRLWDEHKLPSKEFDAWAASRTWWDREPNDDRPLLLLGAPIVTARAVDAVDVATLMCNGAECFAYEGGKKHSVGCAFGDVDVKEPRSLPSASSIDSTRVEIAETESETCRRLTDELRKAYDILAKLREVLLTAVDDDVDPDEQLIDTLKRIVCERDAAIAVAAAERARRRGKLGIFAHILQEASAVFASKIDQGPAPEGSPATPTSSSEGERRQDAGVVGTTETADFLPLRQPESTGPAPAPDHSHTDDVVVVSSQESHHE